MKHKDTINPKQFIKSEDEKQEFTYPMWFKSKDTDAIIRFDGLRSGLVVKDGQNTRKGEYWDTWLPHTKKSIWEQTENPNEHLDRLDDIVDEAINESSKEDYKDMINPEHYKIGGIETIDFMKAKSTKEEFLGHLRLTALKYLSRFGKKDNELQELKKAKWYLDKLISELEQ